MKNEDHAFVYCVSVEETKELNIEIFPYTIGLDCQGDPIHVINSFDELINFIEQLPEPLIVK